MPVEPRGTMGYVYMCVRDNWFQDGEKDNQSARFKILQTSRLTDFISHIL